MDDMAFPSYSFSKATSKHTEFGESKPVFFQNRCRYYANHDTAGDAMVRELDMSRITLRLMEKEDKKGEGSDNCFAKLVGETLSVLQRCLVSWW